MGDDAEIVAIPGTQSFAPSESEMRHISEIIALVLAAGGKIVVPRQDARDSHLLAVSHDTTTGEIIYEAVPIETGD